MNPPEVSIRLIQPQDFYRPGERLAGEYFVDIADPTEVRAVELSVLWHTEGKGDEDMAVHHFQRTTNENGSPVDLRLSQPFQADLPSSPLSYDGVIVKIHWCVRIRVFLKRGREIVGENRFQLGKVPRAKAIPEIETTPAEGDAEGKRMEANQSND